MAIINKDQAKLGFWVAFGFFLFGLVLAAAQWGFGKVRK